MSSPNRTRSMARTLSPLALHDALPDTSGLLAPSPTPDTTPCTCSVCCMLLTPARDFSTAASVRPASFRTPTFRNATEWSARTHVDNRRRVSPLRPRQPLGLPAAELPSVTVGIEWPFEPVRHVATARKACRRHRLGRLQTSLARTTNEKQFAVAVCTNGSERFGDALHEGCVEPVVREALPFDQHRPLADRRQIRQAHVGPLGNRPHVDQHGSRVALQTRPRLVHRNGCNVDLTHASLHL